MLPAAPETQPIINSIIANVFYQLELIESYGTGIQRIIESYKGNKYQPSFAPAPASFVVVLPNMNYIAADNDSIRISNEDKVLQLFDSKEYITRRDIEKLLDCSAFPAAKILTTLLKQNRIERTGTARATKYILKRQ